MKNTYLVIAGILFCLFCILEYRGVAFDSSQGSPKPTMATRSSASGGRHSSSSFFFSSK